MKKKETEIIETHEHAEAIEKESIPTKIDPRSDEPILHQALKMALDDEYRAYEAYVTVVEKFGAKAPFTNIIEAEQRHQKALIKHFEEHEIPLIQNRWVGVIEAPNSMQEAYMLGVNAELENIALYDTLIAYTGNHPEIQDLFYRLQAASYNNHLPALQAHLKPEKEPHAEAIAQTSEAQNIEAMIGQMGELSELAGKFANGQIEQEDVLKLLSGSNASFIVGALVGAVGAAVLNKMNHNKNSNEEKE